MKTFKTLFAAMLTFLAMATLTACSDDDNDEPQTPAAAKEVQGTYTGEMACVVMGQNFNFPNLAVKATAKDDSTIDIEVPSYGPANMEIPTFVIKDVKVNGTDGNYTFAPTEFEGTTTTGKLFSGTLEGTCVNGTISFKFNLKYGSMPMPLVCNFTGKATD
ncbi:MAG: calycin-like domain-containing protein [Prevotella sp.]|nr:calycin-like domain-containing protein [Bacteroides sp.]MCM1365993.1 calycin-like domain-containing protein [Prevotella sp.]MCM1437344.1 calycin-like domain-containing protein [Prevotella sp.]